MQYTAGTMMPIIINTHVDGAELRYARQLGVRFGETISIRLWQSREKLSFYSVAHDFERSALTMYFAAEMSPTGYASSFRAATEQEIDAVADFCKEQCSELITAALDQQEHAERRNAQGFADGANHILTQVREGIYGRWHEIMGWQSLEDMPKVTDAIDAIKRLFDTNTSRLAAAHLTIEDRTASIEQGCKLLELIHDTGSMTHSQKSGAIQLVIEYLQRQQFAVPQQVNLNGEIPF